MFLMAATLILCSASPLTAFVPPTVSQTQGDSAAAAAVVSRFHDALASGDSAAALALFTEDAIIVESGAIESLQEYRSHHLPADIGFVRAMKMIRSPVRVTVRGDIAWTTGTSATRGNYRGKAVNSSGAELMVLTRAGAGWKISAIHWSSRNRS